MVFRRSQAAASTGDRRLDAQIGILANAADGGDDYTSLGVRRNEISKVSRAAVQVGWVAEGYTPGRLFVELHFRRITDSDRAQAAAARDVKTCPRCAEDVKAAAQVCRFCGHEFGH